MKKIYQNKYKDSVELKSERIDNAVTKVMAASIAVFFVCDILHRKGSQGDPFSF